MRKWMFRLSSLGLSLALLTGTAWGDSTTAPMPLPMNSGPAVASAPPPLAPSTLPALPGGPGCSSCAPGVISSVPLTGVPAYTPTPSFAPSSPVLGTGPLVYSSATGNVDGNLGGTQPRGTGGRSRGQIMGDLGMGAFGLDRTTGRLIPVAGRAAFKISEVESPNPVDRVYLTYNYFNNVAGGTLDPRGSGQLDIHRQVLGIEKTIGENMSVGVRIPFYQQYGVDLYEDGFQFGDISVIGKYALYNDLETGNCLSGGLVVTIPIEDQFSDGVLLQPFVGTTLNFDKLYVMSFSSVAFGTDGGTPWLSSFDLAIGYRLLECDGLISYITPATELHYTFPLNNRGLDRGYTGTELVFPQQVILTNGVHIGLGDAARLSIGGAIPITGPKLYDWEGTVQLNLFF